MQIPITQRIAAILVITLINYPALGEIYLDLKYDAEGNIHIPAHVLPPSRSMSPESLKTEQTLEKLPPMPTGINNPGPGIDQYRDEVNRLLIKPMAEIAMKKYPVDIIKTQLADVPVDIISPKGGVSGDNSNRLLINLHGGAWFLGNGGWQGQVESIPIASTMGIKVVAIDYRQGPEYRHPAAVDDVLRVYQALLETYPSSRIGIFGCSAGGMLTAMSTAAIVQRHLPLPGAIGIYGAGATTDPGDSYYMAAALSGISAPSLKDAVPSYFKAGYFQGIELNDPIISPANHPDLLAGFPPTQIITGGRALDLSPSIITHRAMVNAGVDARLYVWEGMQHCFITRTDLPEAQEAYRVIAHFFKEKLH